MAAYEFLDNKNSSISKKQNYQDFLDFFCFEVYINNIHWIIG